LVFPYVQEDKRMALLRPEVLQHTFPKTWEYLLANRAHLENREEGRHKGPDWYRYGRSQNLGKFDQPKLLLPYMTRRLSCCFDPLGVLYTVNVTTGGYGITLADPKPQEYLRLMGIINSRVAHYWMRARATVHQGGYYGVMHQYLRSLPIAGIDPGDATNQNINVQLVGLVQRMLDLQQRKAQVGIAPSEMEGIQQAITVADQDIDDLVYDLYGLTAAERWKRQLSGEGVTLGRCYAWTGRCALGPLRLTGGRLKQGDVRHSGPSGLRQTDVLT
jgi:hypothetical protein